MTTSTEKQETYLIGGIHYHSRFPREWAESHQRDSGPEECENCENYGSLAGIFIGYCANCAAYTYRGTRGRGILSTGIERMPVDNVTESIYDTYLSGLTLDIGATRLVTIGAPEAMTREEFDDHSADVLTRWNEPECPINPYSMDVVNEEFLEDYIGDHYNEDDEENQEEINVSVLNCHFEGGYNDM
jgi:hypothetical protein